jgi:hypothetical protein
MHDAVHSSTFGLFKETTHKQSAAALHDHEFMEKATKHQTSSDRLSLSKAREDWRARSCRLDETSRIICSVICAMKDER